MYRVIRLYLITLMLTTAPTWAAEIIVIDYIKVAKPTRPLLSNLDPTPDDLGIQGAAVAIDDNNTTGKFMGLTYELNVIELDPDKLSTLTPALQSNGLLIADAAAKDLLQIADADNSATVFNVSAKESLLRDTECRANVLHTIPSTQMETDALFQFLKQRKWDELALVYGNFEDDLAYRDALQRSAKKYRLDIDEERAWIFDADLRRTAGAELPVFTQQLDDYDVLLVADVAGDFDRYIHFNTWLPRPLAGTEGLEPKAWAGVVEQWGAAQLQSRFEDKAGRDMRSEDYAAWLAVRSIGEATLRSKSRTAAEIREYLLSPAFTMAGFKGRKLSYRHWNGQMRQPIPLVHAHAVTANAPLPGYLHQRNELDSLGIDEPESKCGAFK